MKIFDGSNSRRKHKLFVDKEVITTPTREVQTEEKSHKETLTNTEIRSFNVSTPQVKALNILDKLVDQIGNDHRPVEYQQIVEESKKVNPFFKTLNDFNQLCMD